MPEVWLQGAIKNISALLQPVAHALLQAQEEVHTIMQNFPEEKLGKTSRRCFCWISSSSFNRRARQVIYLCTKRIAFE